MMGQNPAVGAANSRFQRTSLSKLKWLVVRDMVEIEAATFLARLARDRARRIEGGRNRDGSFLFPAAGHAEKEGAFTNTQRILQWREKAVDPPGDAVLDSRFRVRDTQGLRVVDASIFPKIPGLFILSAIYMAAEKAADVIIADAREIDRKREMVASRKNDIK